VNGAGHENFFASGQLFAAVRFEGFFGCDHKFYFVAALSERRGFGGHRPPLQILIREMLLKNLANKVFLIVALRKEFLRQHYLDQVHGSFASHRKTLSLFPKNFRNG
jgi:hypothetical protein